MLKVQRTKPIICSNPECMHEIWFVNYKKIGIDHKKKCPECGKTNTWNDDPDQQSN